MSSDDDDEDYIWNTRAHSSYIERARYPVHDACEMEDVSVLQELIFVRQETSESESSSSDSDSDSDNNQILQSNAASTLTSVGDDGKATPLPLPLNGDHTATMNNDKNDNDKNDTTKQPKQPKPIKPPRYYCPHDLNERDDDENTPLHVAIHALHLPHIQLLLTAGANPCKKSDGSTPLHTAIALGALPCNIEFSLKCVKLLLEHNKEHHNLLQLRDESLQTPLLLAVKLGLLEVVKCLLAANSEVLWKGDRMGNRPLTAINRHTLPDMTALLLQEIQIQIQKHQHVNVNLTVQSHNNLGRNALHNALSCGNWAVAKILLDNVNDNDDALLYHKDKRGRTPLQLAKVRGMVVPTDILQYFTQRSDDDDDVSNRDMILDPPGKTLISTHAICTEHHTCPMIRRGRVDPPPENVRRLHCLLNDQTGILKSSEFSSSAVTINDHPPRANIADVLRCHTYPYIANISSICSSLNSTNKSNLAIHHLDPDTAVSYDSFEAALYSAGSVIDAIDKVMSGDVSNAFCAVRPPGHHAGPSGVVTCHNDRAGSHGFCLINNVAIGAAYARCVYRNINNDNSNDNNGLKVAIVDFDVHHGNGTEAIIAQHLIPHVARQKINIPHTADISITSEDYRPWLNEHDAKDVFFASTHGYGGRCGEDDTVAGGWFYPASGANFVSRNIQSNRNNNTVLESQMPSPSQREFLQSQSWTRLGINCPNNVHVNAIDDEMRRNHCNIINCALPILSHAEDTRNAMQRLQLRNAYRNTILPALYKFKPDLILISAGFDAHRKDGMNQGYIGLVEDDYEWLTTQIVKVANSCCNGRVVSVLEGGYKIHGGIVSPFARSVAAHVRALLDGAVHREEYCGEEGKWETHFEEVCVKQRNNKRQLLHNNNHYSSSRPVAPAPAIAQSIAQSKDGGAISDHQIDNDPVDMKESQHHTNDATTTHEHEDDATALNNNAHTHNDDIDSLFHEPLHPPPTNSTDTAVSCNPDINTSTSTNTSSASIQDDHLHPGAASHVDTFGGDHDGDVNGKGEKDNGNANNGAVDEKNNGNGDEVEAEEPLKKRRRPQVDYKQLYEQMKKEGSVVR